MRFGDDGLNRSRADQPQEARGRLVHQLALGLRVASIFGGLGNRGIKRLERMRISRHEEVSSGGGTVRSDYLITCQEVEA